jgi:hypothetical protein
VTKRWKNSYRMEFENGVKKGSRMKGRPENCYSDIKK